MAVTDQPMTRFHLIQRNSEQRQQRLAKHSLRLSESFPVYRLCNIKKKKKLDGFMIFTCTSRQLYIFGPPYSYLENYFCLQFKWIKAQTYLPATFWTHSTTLCIRLTARLIAMTTYSWMTANTSGNFSTIFSPSFANQVATEEKKSGASS